MGRRTGWRGNWRDSANETGRVHKRVRAEGRGAGEGDAGLPGEVGADLAVGVTMRFEQGVHGWALVVADLEHQPATRYQPLGCPSDQPADVGEAIGPGEQGRRRLPLEHRCRQVGRTCGHVWRVGHDHVEAAELVCRQGCEPLALADADVARRTADARQVGSGDVERIGRGVGDPHGRAVEHELGRQRQPDRPRSRAQIGHQTGGPDGRGEFDRHPGDEFGFGPRDEHAPVDGEFEVAE